MPDEDIHLEIYDLEKLWDHYLECEGKSGSPGEWILERLHELETEQRRRSK